MRALSRVTVAMFAAIIVTSSITSDLSAQTILSFQYRHVDQENVEEFIHLETTYWAEVARKAIKDGKMSGWVLWQKTSGWNMDDGANFVFVNIYSNKEQLDGAGSIWNPTEVFPNVRVENISTSGISTVTNMLYFQGEGYIETKPSQYVRVNYTKASDAMEYVAQENAIWQPFIKKLMDEGKTDVTSWGVARLLVPNGASIPFNAITIDGFQNFSGTVQATWDPSVEFPDFAPLEALAPDGFDRIQTYRVVKSVMAADM